MKQLNFIRPAFFANVCFLFQVYSVFGQIASDSLAPQHPDSVYAKFSESEKRFASNAVKGLTVSDGLEATLFASEPLLTNPINIAVDHRGRVWVCETFNYRPAVNGKPEFAFGDRILILEDTTGDGKADVTKVFYQGSELNSPLGIWVMGNKVIVSQSPYVWLLTDEDGDDKADKKEVIFKGIGGTQRDQGIHAFVFGPDGKFYFSYGNAGKQLVDGKDRVFLDKHEQPIDFSKYRQGVIFRCDQEFTNIEIMAENFRNSFEVAVDSYGSMWASDQEETGNQSDRVSFVMEKGNFGYTDEMNGKSWRINRTNLEDDVTRRHWHQDDPGVVPNLLQTGSGFPMGMTIYEGNLLPRRFWDQIILCDAGLNSVRSIPVKIEGAGYKASPAIPVVEGSRDKWFRPTDVCVAPDGSLIVSDWYDPVIGNNQMKDRNRGRIFRIAPPETPYKIPSYDLSTPEGAVQALQNPNLSVRYMAWNALVELGLSAEPELEKLFRQYNANPKLRARALWVMNKIEGMNGRNLEIGLRDLNPNLRISTLRAIRQRNHDPSEYIKFLTTDRDPLVRRECALAINRNHTYEAQAVWHQLAQQYKGNDRWYLEALGIGAEGQWEWLFPDWLAKVGESFITTDGGKDLVWRARTRQAIPYLTSLASDTTVNFKSRLRYFRAFDFFHAGYEKSQALLKVMSVKSSDQIQVNKLALLHLDASYVKNSQRGMIALQRLLDQTYGTSDYIELVTRYEPEEENDRLYEMAVSKSDQTVGRDAGKQLLKQAGKSFIVNKIASVNDKQKSALLASIQSVGEQEATSILQSVALDGSQSIEVRKDAARFLGSSWDGEEVVVRLLKGNQLQGEVKEAALEGVKNAFREEIKSELAEYFPKPVVVETPVEVVVKKEEVQPPVKEKKKKKRFLF